LCQQRVSLVAQRPLHSSRPAFLSKMALDLKSSRLRVDYDETAETYNQRTVPERLFKPSPQPQQQQPLARPAAQENAQAAVSTTTSQKEKSKEEPLSGTVGFIGCGQMSSAILQGMISSKIVEPKQIICSDASEKQLASVRALGVRTTLDNAAVAQQADYIILGVKPNIIASVLTQIRSHIKPEQLLISVAAGVNMSSMAALCPPKTKFARVMPNTPCLVGSGATGVALGTDATEQDERIVHRIFSAVGVVQHLQEENLNAVAGVSGSGPAYIFVLIEALADGGVRAGLTREVAQSLAANTVLGAAKMVLQTGKHPAQLKESVTSPGGTTIAALHSLEQNGFRGAVMDAVLASASKSAEMSKSIR